MKTIHNGKGADKSVQINLYKIIKQIIEKINMPIIICSDSNEKKKELEKYILSKNGKILDTKPINNIPSMIYDFFLLSNSKGIIQYISDSSGDDYYGGWSSFSNVAAYIKDIPLITCVSNNNMNRYTYFQEYFDKIMKIYKNIKENKITLHNIYYQDEFEHFASHVMKII